MIPRAISQQVLLGIALVVVSSGDCFNDAIEEIFGKGAFSTPLQDQRNRDHQYNEENISKADGFIAYAGIEPVRDRNERGEVVERMRTREETFEKLREQYGVDNARAAFARRGWPAPDGKDPPPPPAVVIQQTAAADPDKKFTPENVSKAAGHLAADLKDHPDDDPVDTWKWMVYVHGEKNAREAYWVLGKTPPDGAPASGKEATPTGTATPQVSLSVDEPSGDPIVIFDVTNLLGVHNGGTSPSFTTNKAYVITELLTYHYNDGKGTAAGTIALKAASGTTYGPWQAALSMGVYWVAKPNIRIPAGTYSVIDSDPPTWAQNAATGGQGMTVVHGKPVP